MDLNLRQTHLFQRSKQEISQAYEFIWSKLSRIKKGNASRTHKLFKTCQEWLL